MRICLLQATYPDGHVLREHDQFADPSRYVDQHSFHNRMIDKVNARSQIDAAVKEKFDFYFNFLWGQLEDEVAGIEATEYFESLNVPFIGLRSRILRKSKTDFYNAARKRGSPPVPADKPDHFPVIVKAAASCASQFLTSKSICFTAEERDAAIVELDRQLQPGRLRRLENVGQDERQLQASVPSLVPTVDNLPEDIIVQEFVRGIDYSVVVIEFGNTPIALNPTEYDYPAGADAENEYRFLSFDLKFHPSMSVHLIDRGKNPALFSMLQKMAVKAFEINGMGGSSWANVDIRVTPGGRPVVMEVNPMPAIFLPPEHAWEDPVISESLPGGHRALLNIVLASYFMQNDEEEKARLGFLASAYDAFAPKYEWALLNQSSIAQVVARLVSRFDYDGSILDLGCGNGWFCRHVRAQHRSPSSNGSLSSKASENGTKDASNDTDVANGNSKLNPSSAVEPSMDAIAVVNGSSEDSSTYAPFDSALVRDSESSGRHVGVDLSPEMARLSEEAGYDQVIIGSMQQILPGISEAFDHIVCYQAIHFVSTFELSLVLSRCFQLARKSVTIGVDEIPDEYNKVIRTLKPPNNSVTSINHIREIREFGIPRGWKLVLEEHQFGWTSTHTGVDVFHTVFRYEPAVVN